MTKSISPLVISKLDASPACNHYGQKSARCERHQQPISWHSNMNKTWSILSGLLLLSAQAAQAQFLCTTNNGAITITGYTGAGGDVAIPDTITGRPVASIESNAFLYGGLTNVTIPGSVTSIGDFAFYGCSNLASVTLSNGVASLGRQVFFDCTSLTSLTLPGSVTSTGLEAFGGCSNLASAIIPGSVTNIGDYAFYECSNLTSATIPGGLTNMQNQFYRCANLQSVMIDSGVTSIAAGEFDGLASLTNVTIPGSVTSIGSNAFVGTGLASAIIPGSVTSLGGYAFYGCSNLASVMLSDGVASIGDYAFYECARLASETIPGSVTSIGSNAFVGTGLTSVTIPGSVTSIGNFAFYGCTNLAGVTISNGVASIGQQAFGGCARLAAATIPGSVTNIGDNAFLYCSNLISATVPGCVTNMGNQFYGCRNLQNVTIDSGATSISVEQFYGFSNLTRVTIPRSVTSIGKYAFVYCPALATVFFQGNAPAVGSEVFYNEPNATVYYLPGATGWQSTFASQPSLNTSAVLLPSITTPPRSRDALAGSNVFLSVAAKGTLPLHYQWRFSGNNIPGATATNLAIQNFQLTNAGSYQVVITNDFYEIITSAVATVTLVTAPSITSQPAGESLKLGSNVTLQVTAAGTGPLAYQWRLNGAKLSNGSHVSGATNAALTLTNVTTNNAGNYVVVVTNAFASATSSVASVIVVVPPSITTQPANANPPPGGIATFSVNAAGTPLNYIWSFGGHPLSDGASISGSASNKLTVNLVASSNVGSYWVVVSNSTASVTSRVVQLTLGVETNRPSVAIISPQTNSRVAAPILRGTASDPIRVQSVNYWVTNVNNGVRTILQGQAALAAGTGSLSNWTIQTPLLPGTNILAVQSSNYSGHVSPVKSAAFFYQVKTPFHWLASPAGMGTVTGVASVRGDGPPTNGAGLYVGEGYTLTANPAHNWWLTNWMTNGVIAGTNTTLAFIMEPNLAVTANFATNLFVGMAARYDGIFYLSSSQGATEATSGLIENVLLKTNGVYSGKMYLAGTNFPLAGTFDRSGHATETITRTAAEGGRVTLDLSIPWESVPRQITGSVQGTNLGGWISTNLCLYAATTNRNNFPAYTVLLPQDPNLPGSPPDYGYVLITNNGSMIALGGVLADGTPFSRSVPINEQDQFPVYASLYNGQGLLLGQMSLASGVFGAVPAGSLTWIKPLQHAGLYTNGFTTGLGVEGSPWTNTEAALTSLFAHGAQLAFSGGGLASNLIFTVQLTSSNTLRWVGGSANFTSGSINRNNGLMTFTFHDTSGHKVTAYGTALQNTKQGGGFFLGATNAGTITLTPASPANE